jgi:hypothetical protein
MAIALLRRYTPQREQMFRKFDSDQCAEWPLSSLLLVANRIDATKTAMMTETTTYGEEICIAQAPCCILE